MKPNFDTALLGNDSTPSWLADDLARIEALLLETAGASSHPLVAQASTHLVRAGGKRLRPALVMISSHAGEPGLRATDLAAGAVELVHLATLYHDDVIDETPTRRGVATVHSRWGSEVAVLSGDYLFACGSGLGAQAGGEVPLILARAIAEVCEGQIVETEGTGDPKRSPQQYIATIKGKTAALFRAACELGCTTSGASNAAAAALSDYGNCLGLAFQIVDDLLDFVGDAEVIGKLPGTDLKEGVFTLPVLLALEREPSLGRALSDGQRNLEHVLPVLRSTGALVDAAETAAGYVRAAHEALAPLPDEPWRAALEDAAVRILTQVPEGSFTA